MVHTSMSGSIFHSSDNKFLHAIFYNDSYKNSDNGGGILTCQVRYSVKIRIYLYLCGWC